jgi:hypothetical protein
LIVHDFHKAMVSIGDRTLDVHSFDGRGAYTHTGMLKHAGVTREVVFQISGDPYSATVRIAVDGEALPLEELGLTKVDIGVPPWPSLRDADDAAQRSQPSDARPSWVAAHVPIPGPPLQAFFVVGRELLLVGAGGGMIAVDASTARVTQRVTLDVDGYDVAPRHADEHLVVFGDERRVCAFDRATGALTFHLDEALPGCALPLAIAGGDVAGFELLGPGRGLLRRVDLWTGIERTPAPVDFSRTGMASNERLHVRWRHGLMRLVSDDPARHPCFHVLHPDGSLGPSIPTHVTLLDDAHLIEDTTHGWRIARLDGTVMVEASVRRAFPRGLSACLTSRRVAGTDARTGRYHVWTFEGREIVSFDPIEEVEGLILSPGGEALWLRERDQWLMVPLPSGTTGASRAWPLGKLWDYVERLVGRATRAYWQRP